ncbi:hypothetical protein K6V92_24225 [Cupriavidus respiraculi]|uniref:hypothetical protein n=1 Tax=Cupriavidus respiraculi TaxID=195930 RepID=UPI001C9607D7|nr:hypothetical protein [Cupriavidus respiraculi]MBY4949718.1 hypothetical protein [Cupriavidus respiraculi]
MNRQTGTGPCAGSGRHDPGVFPSAVRAALGKGQEQAALRLAWQAGHRDPKALTNLVFFARHPERRGCALRRGEPRFAALGREWLRIRSDLVRPLLGKDGAATAAAGPAGLTLYPRIPLGAEGKAQPITGIYLPAGYRPTSAVDIIVYLHGHKAPCGGSEDWTIESIWRSAFFPLREGLDRSGRNAVLVAPTLGARSQAGDLVGPGGLDRYLERVRAALAASAPFRQAGITPAIGRLILACHSGGGAPMAVLATSRGNRHAAAIRECWGFDSQYGDPSGWARWARSRPDARLYLYYYTRPCARPPCPKPLTPEVHSRRLQGQGLPNVIVAATTVSHCKVPAAFWQARIAGAGLAPAGGAAAGRP